MKKNNAIRMTALGVLVCSALFIGVSACSSDDNPAPSETGDGTGGRSSTGGKGSTGGSKNDGGGDGGGSSTGGKSNDDAGTGGKGTGGVETDGGDSGSGGQSTGGKGTGGTVTDGGTCKENTTKHCLDDCNPDTPEKLLNVCNGISSCIPFDNSKLTKLNSDGTVPKYRGQP